VLWLLNNWQVYPLISKNGQEAIMYYWNPSYAAKMLVKLSQNLMEQPGNSNLKEGPCSRA